MVERCSKLALRSGGAAECTLPRLHIGRCVPGSDTLAVAHLSIHAFEGSPVARVCSRCACVRSHRVHAVTGNSVATENTAAVRNNGNLPAGFVRVTLVLDRNQFRRHENLAAIDADLVAIFAAAGVDLARASVLVEEPVEGRL